MLKSLILKKRGKPWLKCFLCIAAIFVISKSLENICMALFFITKTKLHALKLLTAGVLLFYLFKVQYISYKSAQKPVSTMNYDFHKDFQPTHCDPSSRWIDTWALLQQVHF